MAKDTYSTKVNTSKQTGNVFGPLRAALMQTGSFSDDGIERVIKLLSDGEDTVSCAYEIYEEDGDLEEFVDTVKRVIKYSKGTQFEDLDHVKWPISKFISDPSKKPQKSIQNSPGFRINDISQKANIKNNTNKLERRKTSQEATSNNLKTEYFKA